MIHSPSILKLAWISMQIYQISGIDLYLHHICPKYILSVILALWGSEITELKDHATAWGVC